MTAYAIPWKRVDLVETGRQYSALLAPRKAGRHATVGATITLYAGGRLRPETRIGTTICTVRAPVLMDAEGVRSALPIDSRATPWGRSLEFAWRDRDLRGIAFRLGYSHWNDLTKALREAFGDPPWVLELVGWEPIGRSTRQPVAA